MTFATAVPILFTSFVYRTNVYCSVIHGIKRKPHLSVVWNWYQPRPTDSADINTRLQRSDTSSIPPMHGGFLLSYSYMLHCVNIYTIWNIFLFCDVLKGLDSTTACDGMICWPLRMHCSVKISGELIRRFHTRKVWFKLLLNASYYN